MLDFLDFFRLEELFEFFALICLLAWIGGQITGSNSKLVRGSLRAGSIVFFVYVVLALYQWGIDGPSQAIVILLRALLAAGVTYGVSLLVALPIAFLVRLAKPVFTRRPRQQPIRIVEPVRMSPPPVRDIKAELQMERDRNEKVEGAKTLLNQFYDEHYPLLEESMPRALFTSQMQIRFFDGMSSDAAWQVVCQSVTEMLPHIEKGRERKQTQTESEMAQAKEAQSNARMESQALASKDRMQRITQWYVTEKQRLQEAIEDPDDLISLLNELREHHDKLMKETIKDFQP
jgi:hypothetical protein